ncbi:MAG: SdrD B-like domain-containing protein, partial [Anaerolineae bacterium]
MTHALTATNISAKKRSFIVFMAFLLALSLVSLLLFQSTEAAPGDLSVEILAGYNLVVDSNVESPSTYAPSVATVAGKFCNTSASNTLTNVQGYIGDYTAGTPGLYPQRAVNAAFIAEHPHLDSGIPGDYYAFEHVGGRMGTADATRYVGDLAPGECKLQYWHFTYPRRGNPDNTGNPVWGETRDPNDDLWLQFDIWGEAAGGESDNATWTMTMRNEISAMANKIEPNPLGHWFNTDTSTIRPGSVITSNGILYELGNINQGFDNNGDFVPDYNAWLQPIGDPNYDPSCFRLIRTSGVITISRSGGKPDMVVPFTDQLYFTNLPPDNTGVIGEVFYSFLALDGPCTTALTPYQEVASGFENEKFNGDFGSGIPPVVSLEPQVTVDKSGDATVTTGGTINYSIDFSNNGSDSAGLPLNSTGIVISDSIPAGTALTGLTLPVTATVLYSTDGGQTFSPNQPADLSTVTTIQWWLTEPLDPGAADSYNVSLQAPATPPSPPIIENCASASFGQSAPFTESCTSTRILGSSSLGDFVWQDDDGDGAQDGGETGINDVTVSLYYDVNGDGALDDDDLFLESTTTYTNVGDGYYEFTNLADGDYLVVVDTVVDTTDTDLPFGYGNTTATTYSVKGLGTTISSPYLEADFGFGPILALDKQLVSSSPVSESHEVIYTIEMINTRPGDGTGQSASCTYTLWSGVEDTTHSGGGTSSWSNPANVFNPSGPDALFASSNWQNNSDLIAGTNFNLANQGGNITSVEALMSIYVEATDSDTDGPIEDDMMTANLYFNDVLGPSQAFTT